MRRVNAVVIVIGFVAFASFFYLSEGARAADGVHCNPITRVCVAKGTKPASGHPKVRTEPRGERSRAQGTDKDRPISAAMKRYQAALGAYRAATRAYQTCMTAPGAVPACGNPPRPPTPPLNDSATGAANPSVRVTGEEAAVSVIARLQLPTITPEIGPSPQLNEWKMAAVGYPIWLSAGGQTHVGPVTDSAGGLTVSLDAKVSGVSFRMGDGHVVNCAGTGRRWTRSVQPGAASPTCGYRYTQPSLPKGSYTVAAVTTWSVRWTAGGDAGVITVPAVATTQLPVGELQVLVR